jgi:hypothetical protein
MKRLRALLLGGDPYLRRCRVIHDATVFHGGHGDCGFFGLAFRRAEACAFAARRILTVHRTRPIQGKIPRAPTEDVERLRICWPRVGGHGGR